VHSEEQGQAKPPSTATTLGLGDVHDDADMQVSVTNLRRFTTSGTAKPARDAPAFAVDVVLVNKSAQPYSPAHVFVKATVGGTPVAEVYDHESGVDAGVSAQDVGPGGRETIPYGFSADKAGPLVVTVTGVRDVPLTFTGTL
jgi:hypothetical protein